MHLEPPHLPHHPSWAWAVSPGSGRPNISLATHRRNKSPTTRTSPLPLFRTPLNITTFCRTKQALAAVVDISRPAQISDIEASFRAANDDFNLNTLRHPNNPKLTAVESYPLLPDADIWANQYDLFRFTERPGERPPDVEDERLDCAILRPMRTEYDSFLAYYLTKDDESALQMKETRASLAPYQVPEDQEVSEAQLGLIE